MAEEDGVGRSAGPAATGSRVVAILRHPRAGWERLDADPITIGALFAGYAAPLAAIGPIARAIRSLAFGGASMGIIEYRPTAAGALLIAVTGWLIAMAALWLLSLAIDFAAPWFGGTRNRVAATKVAVFGASAWLIASGFAVIPGGVALLQLLGLYSLFLLIVGAPILMHADEERATGSGFTAAGAGVVLLIGALVAAGAVARGLLRPTVQTASGRVVVAGAPAIPGSRLTAPAADKSRAAAPGTAAAATGAGGGVPASALQNLLPGQIGGFVRTSVESQSSVTGGLASADAKGTYVQGTNSYTLTITDAGAPGALATNNSVIAGEVNKVTDSGFQRSTVVNGVRVTEKWSYADHGGSYSRIVAGRFTVEAQGTAPDLGTLQRAVLSIDQTRLAALAL